MSVVQAQTLPTTVEDAVNAQVLAVSEDRVQGFVVDPLGRIAELSGLPVGVVTERIAAMLRAGTIRRVRQTLITTSLAPGALVAWKLPPKRLTAGFEKLHGDDPFTGHVVTRTTDRETPGSGYRLWTTLKVPVGYSLKKHCELLAGWIGAEDFVPLPAKKLFALGVGHMRRRGLEPGSRSDEPGRVLDTKIVELDERQWRVVTAMKRPFTAEELGPDLWTSRAEEAGLTREAFIEAAQQLDAMGIVGRFSTFLEHVKQHRDGSRVTRFNALFHWRVPEGQQLEAGREVGRHHCMTHAYWREGGPKFADVNVMGVAHGLDKQLVLDHKSAIDEHLEQAGIPVRYTNVFWGGRSEIKPSEISPLAYRQWCEQQGIDPRSMREDLEHTDV
jgi:hypothetical protein